MQAWGSNTNYQIDPNIENATIIATNSVKTYSSYTYTNIDYPGAISTAAYGINDIWDGSFINGAGQVGQVVGQYTDSNFVIHGFLLDGLIAFTPINYPGATSTVATGINNSGQIVGYWSNSTVGGGFLLNGGTYTSFNYPGSLSTTPSGINDAGQVVGYYFDASGTTHGFLYYGPKFYSFDYPGGTLNFVGGVNGDGTIVGAYYDLGSGCDCGFAEYAIPPTWTGTFTSFSYPGAGDTFAAGINNDNQLTGYFYGGNGPADGFQFSNGILFTSFQFPSASVTALESTNDFNQAAGIYVDAANHGHGFVALPNI